MIETFSNLDNIICAFPSTNRRLITVKRIFVQNGKHMEFKHNLSQGPIIVEYLSDKESTEKKYTSSQWPVNARLILYTKFNVK